jgi:hypothetical protein
MTFLFFLGLVIFHQCTLCFGRISLACWESKLLKGIPANYSFFERLVVFGDIHGSWDGMLEILHSSGLIVSIDDCEWKSDIHSVLLVQTGDVVDRGKFSLECYLCLKKLQVTADQYSSRVVRLLGNHELLWLRGEYDYSNKEIDTRERKEQLFRLIVDDVINGPPVVI